MVYVACIGDDRSKNIFMVGVFSTEEKASRAAMDYLKDMKECCPKTIYTRWWTRAFQLDYVMV